MAPELTAEKGGPCCCLLCGLMAISRDLFLSDPSTSRDQAMFKRLYEEVRRVEKGRLITLRCGPSWIWKPRPRSIPKRCFPAWSTAWCHAAGVNLSHQNVSPLEQCFSNFNMHLSHLEILFKWTLWFSWTQDSAFLTGSQVCPRSYLEYQSLEYALLTKNARSILGRLERRREFFSVAYIYPTLVY